MGTTPLHSRPIEPSPEVESVKVDSEQALAWEGIQRRRHSKHCTREGSDARRPVSSCAASDRRTRGEPARSKAPRSSYDPPSACRCWVSRRKFFAERRRRMGLDLFETRRASPRQRTRERVTTGCSRLVEWGLWRSQWESNLDSVNLGQSHSSVTRRNALLAASEQTGNGPEATCPGTSRNTREVSAQSQGGAHASWLCCRSRSTTLRTTILRLRSGNVGRASPEAGDRAGRCDVGRRVAVAKPRDRRRPEKFAPKG